MPARWVLPVPHLSLTDQPASAHFRAAAACLAADLAALSPEALLGAVRPVLPALRKHMGTAVDVVLQGLSDDVMAREDRT